MSAQDHTAQHPDEDIVPIPGLPDNYRASRSGFVWTNRDRCGNRSCEWRKMRGQLDKKGRLGVGIFFADGRRKQVFVHRLILLAFVGPCPEGMECRHLDGNSLNNRLDNLCWGTHSDNELDKLRHGTFNKCRFNEKISDEEVNEIRRLSYEGATNRELAARYSLNEKYVSSLIKFNVRIRIPKIYPIRNSRGGPVGLTESDIHDIFRLKKDGIDAKAIAKIKNVTPYTIRQILARKLWKRVVIDEIERQSR